MVDYLEADIMETASKFSLDAHCRVFTVYMYYSILVVCWVWRKTIHGTVQLFRLYVYCVYSIILYLTYRCTYGGSGVLH